MAAAPAVVRKSRREGEESLLEEGVVVMEGTCVEGRSLVIRHWSFGEQTPLSKLSVSVSEVLVTMIGRVWRERQSREVFGNRLIINNRLRSGV